MVALVSTGDIIAALLAGAGLGGSLIIAIGAQNAYVLRQGLRREHVLPIVAFCALSDAALIAVGVAATGAITDAVPRVASVIRWGGAAFLIAYGLMALRRAVRTGGLSADPGGKPVSRGRALTTAAALTWLNPHVYLDTLLLVGSVASSHGDARWVFGAGAAAASVVWFAGLGFGARVLSRYFARPLAWRILDLLIAVTMLTIGIGLILSDPTT